MCGNLRAVALTSWMLRPGKLTPDAGRQLPEKPPRGIMLYRMLGPGKDYLRGYGLRGEKRGRPNLGEHELGGCILVGHAIGGFIPEARLWETRPLMGGNSLGSQQLGSCIL